MVAELFFQGLQLGRGIGMTQTLGFSVEFDGLLVVGRHDTSSLLMAEAQGVAGTGVGR